MRFLDEVKVKLRPSGKEFVDAQDFVLLLEKNALPGVEIFLGGSLAKGTNVNGSYDADVFVRFPLSFRGKDLSSLTEQMIKKVSRSVERIHGSRDYFHVSYKGVTVEIVPVLNVSAFSEAENVTDMSPLHVAYVRSRIRGKEDDVRLAKQFCKSLKVYGAESYIRGFSGHVLELLVLYYGGFLKLIEQASVWGDRVVIDPEKRMKDPIRELNVSKTISPLIIVDPVQENRNAAAAISKESFDSFKRGCRAFLTKPSASFFVVKPLSKSTFAKGMTGVVYEIKMSPLSGSKDVAGTKLKLAHDKIIEEASKYVKVVKSAWEFDGEKSVGLVAVSKATLPCTIEREGPPVREKKACAAFKAKHSSAFVRGSRLYAKIPLAWKSVDELLNNIVVSEYVRSRSNKVVVKRAR